MKRLALIAGALALAGAAVPERPSRGQAHERLDEIAREVDAFRDETGTLPSSLEGLESVVESERLLADPWGNPIYYLRVAGGYWLMSWGADGEPGGEGDAADLVHIAR